MQKSQGEEASASAPQGSLRARSSKPELSPWKCDGLVEITLSLTLNQSTGN